MSSAGALPRNGLIIEGGGSHTSIAVYVDGMLSFEHHGDASNPRSISDSEATDILRDMLLRVQHHITSKLTVFAAHGAASTPHEAQLLGRKIHDLLIDKLPSRIVVVNDLVPVAMSRPTTNVYVAAAGTGTGFIARSEEGKWHRSSGYEFVLSDEGGGYDLGQGALRAAIKDIDGRGQPTLLTEMVTTRLQCERADLQQRLFGYAYQHQENIKYRMASFADTVFAADNQGDDVAGILLDVAAEEIALGIRSLERAIGEPSVVSPLILTGSLLTAQANLRDRVVEGHGFGARFDVSILGSSSLLQTATLLTTLDDDHLNELERSPGIPAYVWKRDAGRSNS
jgi:N-acetylglucosamine kinase-like BadF-type ATPase